MTSGVLAIPCGNELGEGILWDEAECRFFWTDIQRRTLWSSRADGADLNSYALPERLASFALTDRPGVILAAFDRGIASYSVNDGGIDWLCRPALPSGVRFNDGRVDREGRFVVGSMVEDAEAAGGHSPGCLYRLEPDFSLREMLSGIAISNALCFSLDGNEFYHTDTPTRRVYAYSYDTGMPKTRRLLKEFTADEGPDGACVDSEGNIWIAIWGGGRVERLAPDGTLLDEIRFDALQPTCPAFGGAGFSTLAVTSAWEGLAETPKQRPPAAGDVFLVETKVQGLPETRVKLG